MKPPAPLRKASPASARSRPRRRAFVRRVGPLATALVVALVSSACDSRLPLSYTRDALRPQGSTFGMQTREPEPGTASLTDGLPPPVRMDWDSIVAQDTLIALLAFNSTGYFIYRGEPMGYEYELLTAFAEANDLQLRTEVVRDRRDLLRMLNLGVGDVVAARLTGMPEYEGAVALTVPLYSTRPVVVQRTSDTVASSGDTVGEDADPAEDSQTEGDTASPDSLLPFDSGAVDIRARLLQRPSDLGGEEVHLTRASDYYDRIVELSDSLGQSIELVEVQNADQVEPLIQAVAEGRIRLTVSPENLADLSRARFSNISATPAVGPSRPTVWAVRKNAPELLRRLYEFLRSDTATHLNTILYTKYFVDRKAYQARVQDDMLAHESGVISPYDSLLESGADSLGWDWRLLAAQVAQESRFDPRARSWAGARGLLQLMPRTAREMGVSNPNDPAQSVAGGVRYLSWLTGLWQDEIPDPEERLKFVLASYNAGRGHVLDAQRLAEKAGDDPTNWDDVAYWLLQKSKRSVYTDPVVQHGFVRGLEPVQYVSKILQRYDRYRSVE